MELSIQEPTGLEGMLALFDVYQLCMYRPDREKYHQMAQSCQQSDSIRVFACYLQKKPVGVLVLNLKQPHAAEILGIAVAPHARNRGVATHMLQHAAASLALQTLTAETDADAVDFYRKNGFRTIEQTKNYGDHPVIRYLCTFDVAQCVSGGAAAPFSRPKAGSSPQGEP